MYKQNPLRTRSFTKWIAFFALTCLVFISCSTHDKKVNPSTPKLNADADVISKAHNGFGLEMLKILNQDEGDKNVVMSPTSIALALSMIYNGADGPTQDEMKKALAFEGLDLDKINKASLALSESLQDTGSDFTLKLANSIWVQDGFKVNKQFIDNVESNYKAKFQNIDFEDMKAKDTINSWVKENTNKKISSIVDDTGGLKLFIANATYFKGSWTEEFDEKDTQDLEFTNADGTKKEIPTMSKLAELSYKETDDYQAVNLGYGEKERTSMYVFLPKDQDLFIDNLSSSSFDKMTEGFDETQIDLQLPRFKTEYKADLIPSLKSLGIKQAFTGNANFDGIAKKLFVSSVVHKTYLDVNEEGTEAAAVTGGGATSSAAQYYPEMHVNRSFFIAIVDSETSEILFAGSIKQL